MNEQEILEVTGLPPAPPLDTAMRPVANAEPPAAERPSVERT